MNLMIGFYNYTVIPTYISLVSSVFGIISAMNGKPTIAIFCLMVSGLLDMFDGKIARTRKRTTAEKNFGIQLDSLCDLVCFGVLPTTIGFSLGLRNILYTIIFALYILGALIRLAYFNVMEEERQKSTDSVRKYYEGLPVTSVSLILPFFYGFKSIIGKAFPVFYAVLLIVIAFLFVSKIKVKKPGWPGLIAMMVMGAVEIAFIITMLFV